jgi:hypothetical protein
MVTYDPALGKRGAMPITDHSQSSRSSARTRGFLLAVLIAGLVAAVAVFAAVRRPEATAGASPSASTPPRLDATTTTVDEEEQIAIRLREILRIRDRAYRERDIDLLRNVYTTDCPCLRGDKEAIQQLVRDDAVWVGASTKVRIRKLEKVNDRLWVVVADFIGSPFRIETESGDLIRAIEGRSELFRFALSRATVDSKLLLGYAAAVDETK